MRFKTENDGLNYIKGKRVRDVNYIKNPAAKKQMPDSEKECRVDFERWIWAKRFMFSPKELQSLLGEDHRGRRGKKIKEVRYHHINTFVDWAEERPRRRAIIIVNANNVIAATNIVKKVDIIGGDRTFDGLGLSANGKEPASDFWCNWNCSASEWDFFAKQHQPWWRLFDDAPYQTRDEIDEFLATLNLKRIEPKMEIKKL